MDLSEQIKSEINENPIILYMKGTKEMPMCGFSNQVVQILNHYGVEYKDINVLPVPALASISRLPGSSLYLLAWKLLGGFIIF